MAENQNEMPETSPVEKPEPTEAATGTAEKPAAGPEAKPASPKPSAASVAARRTRQFVSLPNGSCSVRVGQGILDIVGQELKGAVGKPHDALLVHDDSASDELVESVRRQLTDAGFFVHRHRIEPGADERQVTSVTPILEALGTATITSDDLVVGVCGLWGCSALSLACLLWCGTTPLALIPTSLDALVEGAIVPRAFDVGSSASIVGARGVAKYLFGEPELLIPEEDDEDYRLARAIMVKVAMLDSEKAFSRLWDRAELIMDGDVETISDQLVDTIKCQGKMISSTSMATRLSITYGHLFADVLGQLVPVAPESACLAEGLRFSARIAAGKGEFAVDDVLAQDELLDTLDIGYVPCDLDPDELFSAIKAERFRTSNRFMIPLPKGYGRVRLASIDEDMLIEHLGAWCDAHADLLYGEDD